MELRKAERKKAKLKIGLSGPSGSGKTYSSLLLASGMADWNKIVLIDTENGSGELYSDLGDYNVITLEAPFSPERYIEAIKSCEVSGMEIIIIDSITHEWDGKGGCLEILDKLGGKFQDWAKVTPRHRAFIDAILQSKCHVITSVRNKQDYAMTNDGNGKLKVEKVGLKEVTREGFEYELTLNFSIDMRHLVKCGKDRTGLFMDKPEFVITPETGKTLIDWANSGVQDLDKDKLIIKKLCDSINPLLTKKEEYESFVKEKTELALHPDSFDEIIDRLTIICGEVDNSQTPPAELPKGLEGPGPVAAPPQESPTDNPRVPDMFKPTPAADPALQPGKDKLKETLDKINSVGEGKKDEPASA